MAKERKKPMPEITDNEFFALPQTRKVFEDLVLCLTRQTDPRISLDIRSVGSTGSTDGKNIRVNHARFRKLSTRREKFQKVYGVVVHEVGHILYTDFTLLNKVGRYHLSTWKTVCGWKFVPEYFREDWQKEIIKKHLLSFWNSLEDGYVENCIRQEYPGLPALYLEEMRDYLATGYESVPEEEKRLLEGTPLVSFYENCVLAYATTGVLDFGDGEDSEQALKVREMLSIIDDAVVNIDPFTRFRAAWKIIEIIGIEEILNNTGSSMPQELSEDCSSPGKKPKALSDSRPGKDKPMPGEPGDGGKSLPGPDADAEEESLEDDSSSGKARETASESHESVSAGKAAKDADSERLMKGIMDEYRDSLEEKWKEDERKTDASEVRKASLDGRDDYRKFSSVPINVLPWDRKENENSCYQELMREIRPVSRRLQRSLLNELKDRKLGRKNSGLVVGKRFEWKDAHRRDMRVFSNRKAPQELKSLAVAVMVDLSGSMSCENRVGYAKKTAALIQDFCEGLDYPVAVYGHDATHTGVNIYTFTEWDGKRKESIGTMAPHLDNQDGAAIRYATKRLSRRPEPNKVLFILSDGQPLNNSYSDICYAGDPAVKDMKAAAKETKRQGIHLICAGIGEDKDVLMSIYGRDHFMDISDLGRMPTIMAKRLKRLIVEV